MRHRCNREPDFQRACMHAVACRRVKTARQWLCSNPTTNKWHESLVPTVEVVKPEKEFRPNSSDACVQVPLLAHALLHHPRAWPKHNTALGLLISLRKFLQADWVRQSLPCVTHVSVLPWPAYCLGLLSGSGQGCSPS